MPYQNFAGRVKGSGGRGRGFSGYGLGGKAEDDGQY